MKRWMTARIVKSLRKGFLLVAGAGLLAVAACDRPMEKAGKAIDDAVDKTGEKIQDAAK